MIFQLLYIHFSKHKGLPNRLSKGLIKEYEEYQERHKIDKNKRNYDWHYKR